MPSWCQHNSLPCYSPYCSAQPIILFSSYVPVHGDHLPERVQSMLQAFHLTSEYFLNLSDHEAQASAVVWQVRSIEDVLSMGQQIQVKIMGHDKGQLQVSHKALTAPNKAEAETRAQAETYQSRRRPSDFQPRQKRPFKPRIPEAYS